MGLFSWLFGRKKRRAQQVDPYVHFEPSKTNRLYPITPKEAFEKKKDSNYWDSQDFYNDDLLRGRDNGSSHLHDNHQHSASIPSFGGFHEGSFAGGGGSGSWDQRSSGIHTGSHGHQSDNDSSSYDTGGGSSGYDSGSSDSGGGDSGGDSGGGGD